MAKKFLLVCINELNDVVSASLHDTREAAKKEMRDEYEAEADDSTYHALAMNDADVCHSEENEYHWHIREIDTEKVNFL